MKFLEFLSLCIAEIFCIYSLIQLRSKCYTCPIPILIHTTKREPMPSATNRYAVVWRMDLRKVLPTERDVGETTENAIRQKEPSTTCFNISHRRTQWVSHHCFGSKIVDCFDFYWFSYFLGYRLYSLDRWFTPSWHMESNPRRES